jgi:hypothetical protein
MDVYRVISFVRCLFRGHVFIHDGFVPAAEGLIVRTRCLRCRRANYSAQQVRKRIP